MNFCKRNHRFVLNEMFSSNVVKWLIFFDFFVADIGVFSSHLDPANLFCEKDRVYLNGGSFCDGFSQCTDDSDEAYGCDLYSCGTAKFKCLSDGSCKDIKVRCDTRKDCLDGSDELHCGHETNIEQCHLQQNRFLCQDKLKCLDFKFICDGVCNCFDCSDEWHGCSIYDEYLCEACSNGCSSGIYKVSDFYKSFSHSQADFKCRDTLSYDPCGQKCFYYGNSLTFRCLNDENYHIRGVNGVNNDKCYNSVSFKNLLIYSTDDEIKMFFFSSNKTSTLQTGVDCTALTAAHHFVYCATFVGGFGLILKISVVSKKTYEIVKLNSKVTSIAVDWITNNIYFTTNSSLSVCVNNGEFCTQLKNCTSSCSSVSLAPKFGLMFWIDNDVIMKAAMDGSSESILVKELGPKLISSMADELTDNLYWIHLSLPEHEGADVKSMNFYIHPSSRSIWNLYTLEKDCFTFAVFENTVYYTRAGHNTIYRFKRRIDELDNLSNDFDILTVDRNASSVKYLYAYNSLLQRSKVTNPCNGVSCSDLCLLRPSTSSKGLIYTCMRRNITSNKIAD
ncbi:low-density lipoprotein receptor-related protein 1B-like [Planococcus citri]|uniref:low-density lipoprotein receptor-related protein 1B-like n=1 Tax=Planococcus citri TaxID=170843 RepID=UPI0031F7862C